MPGEYGNPSLWEGLPGPRDPEGLTALVRSAAWWPGPGLDDLRDVLARVPMRRMDASWARFRTAVGISTDQPDGQPGRPVGAGIDLRGREHVDALRDFLNAWVCHIKRPPPGAEPLPRGARDAEGRLGDVFAHSIGVWQQNMQLSRWPFTLSDLGVGPGWEPQDPRWRGVAEAVDGFAAQAMDAFHLLHGMPSAQRDNGVVTRFRSTATSKVLFTVRPHLLLPWDNQIAASQYGAAAGTNAAQRYRTHLIASWVWLSRVWQEACDEAAQGSTQGSTTGSATGSAPGSGGGAGVPVAALPGLVGRPQSTPVKLLDEWLYHTVTRKVPRFLPG